MQSVSMQLGAVDRPSDFDQTVDNLKQLLIVIFLLHNHNVNICINI
jgi:hypothetical protein